MKLLEKNKALGEDKKFNLVLVGHDDTKEGVASYLAASGMGCVAMKTPIGEMKVGDAPVDLVLKGYAGEIPALVLLDAEGNLVTRNEREILLKLNKLSRGKSKRVKEREARAAAKKKKAAKKKAAEKAKSDAAE